MEAINWGLVYYLRMCGVLNDLIKCKYVHNYAVLTHGVPVAEIPLNLYSV